MKISKIALRGALVINDDTFVYLQGEKYGLLGAFNRTSFMLCGVAVVSNPWYRCAAESMKKYVSLLLSSYISSPTIPALLFCVFTMLTAFCSSAMQLNISPNYSTLQHETIHNTTTSNLLIVSLLTLSSLLYFLYSLTSISIS